MKKIVLFVSLLFSLVFASTALAAPLTTYKAGSVAIGLDMKYSELKADSFSFGKKWNVNYDVEVGVADKIAFEINGLNDKGKHKYGIEPKLQSVEAKAKYQLMKNDLMFLSAYGGLARNKLKISGTGLSSSNTKTSGMVGLTGVVSLRPSNLKLYADLGVGNKTNSWDVGASYAVISNLELDFGYKYYKVKDFKGHGYKMDGTSKGFYVGATLKF